MREFLIFYAYEKKKVGAEIEFANFILEASTFPEKGFVKEKIVEDLKQYHGGNSCFRGITGITQVHRAEVPSWGD